MGIPLRTMPMWNRRKLYATMKFFAQEFRPRHSPCRASSEYVSPGNSTKLEGLQHGIHPFRFPKCAVFFASPYSTSLGHGVKFACWNCGQPAPSAVPFLSCWSCKAVQPVDSSIDYFQIFGQEQRYDLKVENLEAKYKEWQKKLHPDLVHSKSEEEKSYAAEQSARVIDAYCTLSQPLSRALYLLQLSGVLVDEEKTILDPELLAEMMDVREAVEEASDQKLLTDIQCQLQRKHEDWSNLFRDAFNKQDFDLAINATQRMRYYERAIEEIVKKL